MEKEEIDKLCKNLSDTQAMRIHSWRTTNEIIFGYTYIGFILSIIAASLFLIIGKFLWTSLLLSAGFIAIALLSIIVIHSKDKKDKIILEQYLKRIRDKK